MVCKLCDRKSVLIETLWNVNQERLQCSARSVYVLIETLWNVNLGNPCEPVGCRVY